MLILPEVSRNTCLDIEKSCIKNRDAAHFMEEVWKEISTINPRIVYYRDHLLGQFDPLNSMPQWCIPGMLATSQLYRAFDREMRRIPRVTRAACHVVDKLLASEYGSKYWQKKRNEFHSENRELSRLLGVTIFEEGSGYDQEQTQDAFDLALSVYILLEIQMELDIRGSNIILKSL